jgi:RNA 2',3'-cyclic 3'-phosphodiesterase
MMLRAFIALELPAELQNAISHSTAPLRKALSRSVVRWVPPQNLHLTLKFLGDISPARLEQLAEALAVETVLHPAFSLSVGSFGAFPNVNRARVLWIGLDAPATLFSLQSGIEAVTTRLGTPPEERKFSPHLTIGRVNQAANPEDLANLRTALDVTTVGDLGTVEVSAVHVFKSDIRPGGPVYTKMYHLPMKS